MHNIWKGCYYAITTYEIPMNQTLDINSLSLMLTHKTKFRPWWTEKWRLQCFGHFEAELDWTGTAVCVFWINGPHRWTSVMRFRKHSNITAIKALHRPVLHSHIKQAQLNVGERAFSRARFTSRGRKERGRGICGILMKNMKERSWWF